MMHPATELRPVDPRIGIGVFATAPIPRGTVTWVRCALDVVLTAMDRAALGPLYEAALERYCYTDGQGDSVLCWDTARYMNHACAPTCASPGFDFDVALRDIAEGEQMTCDYGMLNLEVPFDCLCRTEECRRVVRPDDWDRLVERWDGLTSRALRELGQVEQPLLPLVKDRARVMDAAAGLTPGPSCAVHRFTRAASSAGAAR